MEGREEARLAPGAGWQLRVRRRVVRAGLHPARQVQSHGGPGEAPPQGELARQKKKYTGNLEFDYEVVMAEGDLVAVRWTTRANLVGFPVLMRGMVGKRGPIVSTGVNLYRFRDGRVVEIWNNRDDLTVLREGGVFRWYGVSGFVVGVLVALVAGWGLRRRHVAREGRGA